MRSEDEVRAALREIVAEDAPAPLAEARAAARERARKYLEDLLVGELVAAAAQPPPRAAESGFWLYGVVDAADAESATGQPGLEGAPVEAVPYGHVAALVSAIPLADYGDEHLREHLTDMAWVERTARTHESVLEHAQSRATIVPMRLCTIAASRERVAAMLADDEARLTALLADLRGRSEYGLKVFARNDAAAPADEPADGTGAGYLERRRREREARDEVRQTAVACAQDAHERLEALAVGARRNPPQRPEAHGRDGHMVLNGAYLVEDERLPEVRSAVDALRELYEPLGFSFELTGPWPPYNFAGDPASTAA